MVRIKPFRGIRPPKQYASEVASRPYDVLNSAEAKAEATERSLLHIIKPEIDFDPIADEHSQPVYDKAVENFRKWRSEGWLQQDPEEYYYIYAQTMNGRTQYAPRQGGGPHDPRAQPESQHRTRILRIPR